MKPKDALGLVSALVTLLVGLPIWYYLLYKVLIAVNATDLMWFLYWIYVPAGLFVGVLDRIVKSAE